MRNSHSAIKAWITSDMGIVRQPGDTRYPEVHWWNAETEDGVPVCIVDVKRMNLAIGTEIRIGKKGQGCYWSNTGERYRAKSITLTPKALTDPHRVR